MGASYYISLERPIDGVDPLDVDGKAVCRASDALERLAKQLKVTPLIQFFSANPAELQGLLDDGEEMAAGDAAPEEFYPADDGLRSVRTLNAHLRQNPKAIQEATSVLADLAAFEAILAKAAAEGVRWHLAGDA